MKPNISVQTKVDLWNMFNEAICKKEKDIEELHSKGAHSVANRKEMVLDELKDLAKYLGIKYY